nr:MFS transporter [Enterococcus sp.]
MDRFGSKISFNHLIAGMVVVSMAVTGVQLLKPSFLGTLFLFAFYGIFTFGMISFIDAMSTLYFFQGKQINYPVARGVGSLSYAVSAVCVGFLVQPTTILFTQFLLFIPLLTAVLMIDSIKGVESTEVTTEKMMSFGQLIKAYPLFKFFLIAIMISFIGKEMASNFLIDVYRAVGGSSRSYGVGSFILAASEIPAAILFTKLSNKLGIYRLMLFSFFFAGIRILLIMLAPSLFFLNVAHAFQMLGNGLFWAGNVQFIRTILPPAFSVKAQAAVGVCYLGIGSGVGSMMSGLILAYTNLTTLLSLAALLSFLGLVILYLGKKYQPTQVPIMVKEV